jgi:hypothetical protein
MTVKWAVTKFADSIERTGFIQGHGVAIYIPNCDFSLAFIDGFGWMEKSGTETSNNVDVYINKKIDGWPKEFINELKLAIFLFLTDHSNQNGNTKINGFRFEFNA